MATMRSSAAVGLARFRSRHALECATSARTPHTDPSSHKSRCGNAGAVVAVVSGSCRSRRNLVGRLSNSLQDRLPYMSYKFRNTALAEYLTVRHRAELPAYCERAAFQLSEEVRGYDFHRTGTDSRIYVGMFERSVEQICGFVDWSAEIWNQTMRKEVHRSRRITTDELIANHRLRDGEFALESLLILFEGWHEESSRDEGPYISISRYSNPNLSTDPLATVGNLCAAIGLAVLDRLTLRVGITSSEEAQYELGLAWEFALLARWNNHMEMAIHFEAEAGRQRMVRAAQAKHRKDPRQHVKLQVRAMWQQWDKSPSSYPSTAAFARDMCDKWPDHIASEVVVARWVRDWRRNAKE